MWLELSKRLFSWIASVLIYGGATFVFAASSGHASYHAVDGARPFRLEHVAVFGKDTRGPVPKKYEILGESVGRLWTKDAGFNRSCTAFCVAPDVIATAAHCLFAPAAAGKRPALPSFKVEFRRNRSFSSARIAGSSSDTSHWYVLAGTTRFPSRSLANDARDWALAKLDSAACKNGPLKIRRVKKRPGLIGAVFRKEIFTIAYHGSRTDSKPEYSADCASTDRFAKLEKAWKLIDNLFLDADRLIPHKCDTGRGASGSPLFLDIPEGAEVVGMNVGFVPVSQHILSSKRTAKERAALMQTILTSVNTSVGIAAFDTQIRFMRTVVETVPRESVRKLQIVLKAEGDYTGPINGIYDISTRQAILDSERRHRFLVTGRPSQALLNAFLNPATNVKQF